MMERYGRVGVNENQERRKEQFIARGERKLQGLALSFSWNSSVKARIIEFLELTRSDRSRRF
jgi:hypothetical protein